MKSKYLLLASLIVVIISVFVFVFYKDSEKPEPRPGESYFLSMGQLVELEHKAAKGDVEAMKRLGDYYGFYLDKYDKSRFWFDLAAYAGDRNLREGMIYKLINSKERAEQEKGAELAKRWGFDKTDTDHALKKKQ